jgi:hypothetical protein
MSSPVTRSLSSTFATICLLLCQHVTVSCHCLHHTALLPSHTCCSTLNCFHQHVQ